MVDYKNFENFQKWYNSKVKDEFKSPRWEEVQTEIWRQFSATGKGEFVLVKFASKGEGPEIYKYKITVLHDEENEVYSFVFEF